MPAGAAQWRNCEFGTGLHGTARDIVYVTGRLPARASRVNEPETGAEPANRAELEWVGVDAAFRGQKEFHGAGASTETHTALSARAGLPLPAGAAVRMSLP